MWNWKPAKAMLERLWNHGQLVVAGRQGFQRLYDLHRAGDPAGGARGAGPGRGGAAARARAAGRAGARRADRSGHRRALAPARGRRGDRARRRRLVADGGLGRSQVEDGGAGLRAGEARSSTRRAPTAAVLLSPFDNLLWDRPFARRILGFDHLIEVYKPAPERRYGYYVLPFSGATGSSAGPI